MRINPAMLGLALMSLLSACDGAVDQSRASVSLTNRAYSDSRDIWSELFTYHPPALPQKPQTRYCYKIYSDIVCYDSVQPSMTAKLFGYQDGEQASWIQPGGGSLGASGGVPVALQPVQVGMTQEKVIAVQTPTQQTVVKESSQVGEIQSITLPAPR